MQELDALGTSSRVHDITIKLKIAHIFFFITERTTVTQPLIDSVQRGHMIQTIPSSNTFPRVKFTISQFYVQLEYLLGVLTKRPERVRLAVISSIFVVSFVGSMIFGVICLEGLTFVFCGAETCVFALDLCSVIVGVICFSCFRCTRFLLNTLPSTSTAYNQYP